MGWFLSKMCKTWKVRVDVLKAATAKLSPEGHLHHKEQSEQEESFIFAEGRTSQVCWGLRADADVVHTVRTERGTKRTLC